MIGTIGKRLGALALLLAVAGCAPGAPVSYYTLTPVSQEEQVAETDLVIGVAPVSLASYLDRQGIVTRTSANELTIAELQNWIEPLDIQVRRVVARNLAVLLGTDRVLMLPEQRFLPLDFTVEIAIERFDIEGVDAGEATDSEPEQTVLEGRWTLFDKDGRDVIETTTARIAVPVESPADYERRAAAMSDAVGRLSRAIATRIAQTRKAGA